MLLIIMEMETGGDGSFQCIPLRVHDITDGTLLKVRFYFQTDGVLHASATVSVAGPQHRACCKHWEGLCNSAAAHLSTRHICHALPQELRHPVIAGLKTELAELFNQALVFKQVKCDQCCCTTSTCSNPVIHKASTAASIAGQQCRKAAQLQEGQPLQILDLLGVKGEAVTAPDFPMPAAFIFLWERNCFLSLLRHSIGVWNLQVGAVASAPWHPQACC
jgi:hypothetical protein